MKRLASLILVSVFCSAVHGEVLTAWEFDGYDGNEVTVGSAVVHPQFLPTDISRGSGLSTYWYDHGFGADGFPGGVSDTNYYFNPDDYFEFSVEPRADRIYSITSLIFSTRVPFPYEPTNSWFWRLASDQDGYTGDVHIWGQTLVARRESISLSGNPMFQQLTTATTFRLYGYNVCASTQVILKNDGMGSELDIVIQGEEQSDTGFDDVLTGWEFTGNAGDEATDTADMVDPRFNATDISRGAGLLTSVNADSFMATYWNYAYAADDYLEFSVSPQPGFRYTITNVTCQTFVETPWSSPGFEWRLKSDKDGYTGILGTWDHSVEMVREDVSLAGNAAFENLAEATTFRLYGSTICAPGPAGLEGTNADLVIQGRAWADGVTNANLLAWDFAGNSGLETTVVATTVHEFLNPTVIDHSLGLLPLYEYATSTNGFWGIWSYQWDTQSYFEFSISPELGYEYNVTSLLFRTVLPFAYEPTNGMFWRVKSNRDNYQEVLAVWGQTDTARVQTISLQGHPDFMTVATTTVFRLYGSINCASSEDGLEGPGNDLEVNGQIWLNKFGDVDGDGMGNEWELNGTGSTTGAMVGANFDGDFFTDFEEWLALTNPGNSNDYFHLDDIFVASPPSVQITSMVGRVYTLQYNDYLPTGEWVNVVGQIDVPGNNGILTLSDTVTNDVRSYRVRVKLP